VIRNAVVMGNPALTSIGGLGLFCSHNDLTFNDPDYYGGWVRASQTQRITGIKLTGSEFQQDAQAKEIALTYMRDHASQLPGVAVAKLGRLLTPIEDTSNFSVKLAFAVSWLIAAPLTVIGMWITWRKHRAAAAVLMIPLGATLATTFIYYGLIRFRDSIAPIFLLFAAVAIHDLATRLLSRSRLRAPQNDRTDQPSHVNPRRVA